MNGLLVINKPEGFTSRDVVNIISKIYHTKKVGHTGTLDPLATGVLIICLGKYTKLVDKLTSFNKEYIAEIKLGIKTDTLDITGNILDSCSFNIKQDDIIKAFNKFIGIYHMQVPMYSAIKVNGKKLYEYARNNEKVDLPIKDVHIYELELLAYNNDIIKFRVKVEKGTYIRSLIRDICEELKTFGTMSSLVRTKQGNFKIEDTLELNSITSNTKLLCIKDILNIPTYELDTDLYFKVKNGQKINLNSKFDEILFTYHDKEIAIYKKFDDIYKIDVMLEQ